MARIFLSYAREDAGDAADKLRTKLSLAGHIVWRDIEDMRGGLSWKEQIERQVEAVHCTIVLLTPKGVRSENVEHEWRSAFAMSKRVLPVLILPCEVPPELSRLHYHPATDDEAYERMLMVLLRDLSDIDKQMVSEQRSTDDLPPQTVDYVQEAVRAYSQQLKHLLQLGTEQPPLEPYKELYAFELKDGQIFFGRETDSKRLQRIVLRDRLAVLHARSGAGKTSLVNAGLMPLLITAGYVPIYARAHTDPVEAIKRAVTSTLPHKPPSDLQKLTLHQFLRIAEVALGTQSREIVIILDQFEEFFVLYPQFEQRRPFIDSVADCYEDLTLRARFLLSLRKDYFSDLDEFKERLPGIFINEFRLLNLTRDQAMDAIVEPVKTVAPRISYDQNLLSELLADLETSGMELPHLQIICSQLYTDRPNDKKMISLEDYEKSGRARGILGNYLNKTLAGFPLDERRLADEVLFELVSSQSTKRILEREKLIMAVRAPAEMVDRVLGKLVQARLLRRDKDSEEGKTLYEMAHEYLVDEIQRRASTDPAKMAVKQVKELLQGAVNNWQQGILMSRAILDRIYQERYNLGELTDDELTCVLVSSVDETHEGLEYWLTDDKDRSLVILSHVVLVEKYSPRLVGRIIASFRYIGADAVPFLITLLENPNEAFRRRAANVLEVIDTPEARGAIEPIFAKQVEQRQADLKRQIELQKQKEEEYRRREAELQRMAEESRVKIIEEKQRKLEVERQRKLEELQQHRIEEKRLIQEELQRISAEMVQIEQNPPDYYPRAVALIKDLKKGTNTNRVRALEKLEKLGDAILPLLVVSLKEDKTFELRWGAIAALAYLKLRTKSAAIPELIKMLDKHNPVELQVDAAWLLGQINATSAVDRLTDLVNDTNNDFSVRESAHNALRSIRFTKR